MKVNVFLDSANDMKFRMPIQLLAQSIHRDGHSVEEIVGDEYKPCDLAIIWGSWKDRDTPWHNIKRKVVNHAKNFIVLETPILNRGPVKDVMDDTWYRVGINGFLANTGQFNNNASKDDRWNEVFKEKLGYSDFHGWKRLDSEDDRPIVIVLQLPGDASLEGQDISEWCNTVVEDIRMLPMYKDRRIIIREPQVDRPYNIDKALSFPKVHVQKGTHKNVINTIDDAYCLVTYSSGMGVESILRGTPVYAYSPASFVYDLQANNVKDRLKFPSTKDVKQWTYDMAYTTWSLEEIGKGNSWNHLRGFFDISNK